MLSSRDIAHAMVREIGRYPDKQAEIVASVCEYLDAKNLTQLAPDIEKILERIISQKQSITRLGLRSAVALTDTHITEIKKLVGAHSDVEVAPEVDPSLVSGFVASFDGKKFDASGKGMLTRLETVLVQ